MAGVCYNTGDNVESLHRTDCLLRMRHTCRVKTRITRLFSGPPLYHHAHMTPEVTSPCCHIHRVVISRENDWSKSRLGVKRLTVANL